MGIFARLARLIKSNLNDLISKSEDPEKMLNQVVIDMNEHLHDAKKQVAVAIADEKKLAKQADQEAANAAEWERRAMMAVRSGDDQLAKEGLARKREHAELAAQFRAQHQKQKQAVDQLKVALRALNSKIEEAKRKKAILIARKKRAEAQKAIQETMSGLKNASAFETFDRMESEINQIEAEAEAGAELNEEYTGDVLAQKFQQLEVTAGADEDLLELKRKMGLAEPAPAPAEPQQVRVEGSAEGEKFEELDQAEQEELARALEELEAEQASDLTMKR